MIDFTLAKEDLTRACRLMTSARNNAEGDVVDISCTRENVRFVVTGREITCAAGVESLGVAQVPLEIFAKIGTIAKTYKEPRTRIRIEPARVRINNMAIAIPESPRKLIGDRMIDIPDDASLMDLLAVSVLFRGNEIAESNLTERVLEANSKRLKALESAASILAPLGITPDMLDELHRTAVRQHAERLRPMLLPPLISNAPN